MRAVLCAILFLAILAVTGCVTFGPVRVEPGETLAQVTAKLGTPTHRYQVGTDQVLEYSRYPWGQHIHMARFGPDGKLISYEQVLTLAKFATVKPGETRKEQIRHTFGAPYDTSYLALSKLEVWSYPYKESGVWDSIMHVHFDPSGVVKKMESGPDPRFDPDERWPFGMLR